MKKYPPSSPKPVSRYQIKQVERKANTAIGSALLAAMKKIEKRKD
jgi:hypothetical protein